MDNNTNNYQIRGRQKLQKIPFLNISSGLRQQRPFFYSILSIESAPVQCGSRIKNSHSPNFQEQLIPTMLQAYSPPPYIMGDPTFSKCSRKTQQFSIMSFPSEIWTILQSKLVSFFTTQETSVAPIHSRVFFSLSLLPRLILSMRS